MSLKYSNDSMLASEDLKRKICATRDLPTLPIIAQKILLLRNDDENLAEKLGTIISNDQSLSAKVLTLANSAYFGHRAQIGTIQHAVVVIGTSMLRQFALGVVVPRGLGRGPRERESFWRHSLMAANASNTIAKRCRMPNTELCFMGGLLHDIGKLVMDTNMPDEYRQVEALVKSEKNSVIDAEHRIFETDHTEIGAWMAERWQLPAELVHSIGYHHSLNFASLQHSQIVAIVHAASLCAEAAERLENTPLDLQVFIPFDIEAAVGISQGQFKDIVRDLHQRRAEIQLLFR